jgi:hypothetical protein
MLCSHRARLVLLAALSLVLVGCMPVSNHQGADLTTLASFKIEKNRTTEKELVDHFGQPLNTTTESDGSRILSWNEVRSEGHTNMTKFIPGIGLFTGPLTEQNVTHRSLVATVRDGLVVDYRVNDGSSKVAY